jgi:hypothetical protein
LRERRKKIKEKKAVAMAMANAKKATKIVGKEGTAEQPSDMDEATQRFKVASAPSIPGGGKNVHRAPPQGEARKIVTKAGRMSKKEPTKFPDPGKSKKRRLRHESSR